MKRFRLRKIKFIILFFLNLPLVCQAATTFEGIRDHARSSEGILYDRHRERLHESRVDARFRRLGWVGLDDVSPALKEAVVASEDRRFWSHGGVDWLALAKAGLQSLFREKKRGASTITMQVAAILQEDGDGKERRRRRGFFQKLKQIFAARRIERELSKAQVLEVYLNLITYRGELQGIAAAAEGVFGKAPHGLDRDEALILASLIRAPEAKTSLVEKRACALGRTLNRDYDCHRLTMALDRAFLGKYAIPPRVALAPHVAAQLLKSGQVFSTLDRDLQSFAIESLRRQIVSIQSKNAHDGAILVVENSSGDVLSYVGSTGDLSSSKHVDGVRAERQAGSALKPFLYAMALDHRYLTAASPLEDLPVDIPVHGGVYHPRNYDSRFHGGDVTLRTALASSLNVPAVRTLNLVGVEPFVRKLTELGFENLREAEDYGPSLALGAADVTLWSLVNAYRALANGGEWAAMRLDAQAPHASEKRRIYSSQAAFVISDILSDRESRALTFGLENPLASRFWSAVKTGTSKDMRDNWCVGYSEKYTVGVWVGNFSGEPMWDVSGITGAGPVWAEIMTYLHARAGAALSHRPTPPPGVVHVAGEWFLKGTGPAPKLKKSQAVSKIIYPVEGMVIAFDPDIPTEQQRVFFKAIAGDERLKWVLNGQKLGKDSYIHSWLPKTNGKYTLSLQDEQGHAWDTVRFEVRGL